MNALTSLLNFLLMFGVCLPPALYVSSLLRHCDGADLRSGSETLELAKEWLARPPVPGEPVACAVFLGHPRLFVNLVYFVAVDVGFYVIYLLQGSTWLIDPHWQLIPVCIALFFFVHPDASAGRHPRAYLSLGLLLTWAARLFHNYLRRERWQFGDREDWRYADMRQQHGRWFILTQFFAVSLAQHGMLIGLTMPLQPAMAAASAPLNAWDALAALLCTAGICIGLAADNQLYAYMERKDKPMLLETGLWRYSRHPNHFGEQTWWIGILCLAVAAQGGAHGFASCGAYCVAVAFGVGFNHPIDTLVTLPLIEGRMLRRPERAAIYRAYQQRTSLIVPWWVREEKGKAA